MAEGGHLAENGSSRIDPTSAVSREGIDRRRKLRHVAANLVDLCRRQELRFVMVTSVARGAGRTRMLDALRGELAAIVPGEVSIVRFDRLRSVTPDQYDNYKLVLIDGPPTTYSDELLDTPRNWSAVIQASLLVIMKRHTRRADVKEASAWLESIGMPVVGVVFNEYVLPPLATWWLLLKADIKRRFGFGKKPKVAAPNKDGRV